MEADAYLDHIGYQGPREPTADALRQLHRTHLLTVAFENLDIQRDVPELGFGQRESQENLNSPGR